MATTNKSRYYGSIVLPNSAGFHLKLMQHNSKVGGIKELVSFHLQKQQCIHTAQIDAL